MKPSRVFASIFALAFAGSVAGAAQQPAPAKPAKPVVAPVAAAVKAQYPAARIVKGEKVTRGATVSYKLQLAGAAKKSIALTPEGKPVASK